MALSFYQMILLEKKKIIIITLLLITQTHSLPFPSPLSLSLYARANMEEINKKRIRFSQKLYIILYKVKALELGIMVGSLEKLDPEF